MTTPGLTATNCDLDLVVVNTGPENDDGAIDAFDGRRRPHEEVVAVQPLSIFILIVVEDGREPFGGQARREEVLRRDVGREDEVPRLVVREAPLE